MISEDTIVAISTPPGRGGLGVVRLSGGRAIEIASRIVKLPHPPLETQRATLGTLEDSGRALDQVVVTCFRAPHSYTSEEIVEVSCHGAPIILRFLEERCLAEGARAAGSSGARPLEGGPAGEEERGLDCRDRPEHEDEVRAAEAVGVKSRREDEVDAEVRHEDRLKRDDAGGCDCKRLNQTLAPGV